ncbi:MAG: acyl-CoA thioesterase [Ignavibacteria bacterium]|nr:acyl-CoA thioesterase [Ignavibacteria bacterium]
MKFVHKTYLRPRYADTDQMGIIHHAKYFEYFEIARTEFLRSLGLPYAELENEGYLLPLTDCYAKFIKPIKYDELIRIETTFENFSGARIHLSYKIFNDETNELLSEGFTKHSWVKKNNLKPTKPPLKFLEALKTK